MWHHKTPRRKHRQNILWHKPYPSFLRLISQSNINKSKNKQRGPNQTYKPLHNKETHTKTHKMTIYRLGGNICKWCTDKGLISKIYKQLIQVNNNNKPNQNKGRRPKQFLQRRHTNGNRHMKRCSVSLIIREMQLKTTTRYCLTSVRILKIYKYQMLERVEKRELSYTMVGM